ncbi:MAG: beta-ketoacyl-ACP synthase II [Armatimonadetes bacterium]|nr:beta-ketoacyl-ACP synthase II [Armatimonadota bacterium]
MDFRPSGRVAVTGLGAVTPLGTGIDVFWPRLLKGECGIDHIKGFDVAEFSTRIGAEVKDFNAEDWLDKKEAKRVDRFIAFAVASATQALQDSGLKITDDNRNDIGVLVGSGIGGLTFLAEQFRKQVEAGPSRVSPFLVPWMIPDMASGMISIVHGLRGPNTCVVTACATGSHSIGDAYHIIKRGDAIAMLAGGAEAPINEIGMSGFCAARAMSTRNDDPLHASRPFDKERDGFIIGEGSGCFVLEDWDYAVGRGARIYAEIVGYGLTGDGNHITQPLTGHDGLRRSMEMALRGHDRTSVDYINAHGTSTPINDREETAAMIAVFGEDKVPAVSSTKSMIGHTLGAAGAIEAVICVLAMRDSVLPPTVNQEFPDPDCPLDYVPNVARKAEVNLAMSNSAGFGGHNASLLLKKV